MYVLQLLYYKPRDKLNSRKCTSGCAWGVLRSTPDVCRRPGLIFEFYGHLSQGVSSLLMDAINSRNTKNTTVVSAAGNQVNIKYVSYMDGEVITSSGGKFQILMFLFQK